jgi:proline iminopeptidase
MIGAHFDSMDPEYMKFMSTLVQKGTYLYCPDGSHLCMWDDQQHYFPGVIQFIKSLE